MTHKFIDTDKFSAVLRARIIDVSNQKISITNFEGSDQEKDLTEPPNCKGFGRIRHFRLNSNPDWPINPLPIVPAQRALNLPAHSEIESQVFQNAACNWRCWYCFVDFKLLSADPQHSTFFTVQELIDLYLLDSKRPKMIDLSGGQPDLTPEWILWTMKELQKRKLDGEIYLWSDDNLSTDYFWRYLTDDDRALICAYRNYGKVCCFKGFDPISFSFNTNAAPELFDRQFELIARLLSLDIDLYCYATFTTPYSDNIANAMATFIDRLQELHPNLPLRTVPLEVKSFSPVTERGLNKSDDIFRNQYRAVDIWRSELSRRYSSEELSRDIVDVIVSKRSR